MRVKRIGDHKLPLPAQHHSGDAGYDLMSTVDIDIWPGDQALIPIGFAFEIPFGLVGFIKDRSSMAAKNKMHTMAGVVDSQYRGEVHVCIRNVNNKMYSIKVGDKIAQMVLLACHHGRCVEVDDIEDTIRSNSGFGSTGK